MMPRLFVTAISLLAVGPSCGFTPPGTRATAERRLSILAAQTPLSANGKRIEAAAGSSLMAACNKLGLRVPTNCKKGECGTCTVSVGGKLLRACTAKVPPAPKLKSVLEKGLPVKVAR